MYALMYYEIALITVCLITHITCITAFTSMYALMYYKIALITECLITHITCIRALTSMCALMCYEISLLPECLITQFTWICMLTPTYIIRIAAFTFAYVDLFIQSALVKKKVWTLGYILTGRTTNFIAMYTLNKKSIVFEEMLCTTMY